MSNVMSSYFMGIDTGTSSSKGVIINEECKVIATYEKSHTMSNPKPGFYEHDANKDWWGDFCIISNELLSKSNINPQDIKSIGISALGADCLPVDENCEPLRKAILYGIDSRASEEIEELTNLYGEHKIKQWYGRPLGSSDIMPKILWIKNKEPDVYQKTYKFLTGSSFIVAKLTGNYVVDRFLGLASFNPLYNKKTWEPDPELCNYVCDTSQLAEIKEATDIAGYVSKQASKQTGLAVGTPVITGTDDSGAEAISAGVVESGKMMIQLGSSVYMILGTDKLINDDNLWREEFIVPGLSDISAGTNTAGSLTEWYRDNIFSDILAQEKINDENAYSIMAESISNIPVGSGGLITLPYFAGERTPINDPNSNGLIIGLKLSHTREYLYKSALEGIGYSINQQIKIMESHHEVSIKKIYGVGGGVKNNNWMQIIADILGKTISTPKITLGACYGDAMMAALGVKYDGFNSFSDLSDHIQIGDEYIPNKDNHIKYQYYQNIYEKLYAANKDFMHLLNK